MKNYKIINIAIKLIFINLLLFSCSSDPCDYDSDNNASHCVNIDQKTNVSRSGFTVITQYNSDPNGFVGMIIDTKDIDALPKAEDLNPILTTSGKIFKPANWTPSDIGQVFGIAIDDNQNIYLASSGVYNMALFNSYSNASPAQVFKCSPPTYNATLLFSLPSTGGAAPSYNDIGNIAYDKVNKQLFTTNLEDGKIYRHDLNGTLLGTYDPFATDTGTAGMVSQNERVWCVGVNYESGKVKVYFPRITTGLASREIFSITLNPDGSFPANGTETIEISNLAGLAEAITDIAFSSDTNKMIFCERGSPHDARTISYNLSAGTWSFHKQYFIGGFVAFDGENSAGGVDFAYGGDGNLDCSEFIWASGNYMDARNTTNKIYGIEGVDYNGNNSITTPQPNANQDTDYFIDFNGVLGTTDKGNIGDVEVFDANECFNTCP
jgi:hypothetical protein